ncbi:MAG TPA: hypothetical protein PL070_08100 [Flavobacteriales bacterium]|nr:hypothetical protein [Flavobacteriales bacterium]
MRWLLSIALLLPVLAWAQPGASHVDARLETTQIRIGEPARLELEVSYPANSSVIWPQLADTITARIEIVDAGVVDTVANNGGLLRQVRTLTITAFDSGFWAIPPFQFIVQGEPMATKALLLEVHSVPVDPSGRPRDIKPMHEGPFSLAYWFHENLVWIGLGVLGSLLLGALIVALKRERPNPLDTVVEITVPLKDRILAGLDALEKDRVWQQGDHKSYQSRLTDLLRSYIEERFRVPAMESTTDELLKELRVSPLSKDHRAQLENMLRLADMVKFAKALPSPQENEQMMAAAIRFVNETAPVETPTTHA